MALFLDELKEERPDYAEKVKNSFILDVQNVADYITANPESGKTWSFADFPKVVPPFPDMWLEYRIKSDNYIARIGCRIESIDLRGETPDTRRKVAEYMSLSPIEAELLLNLSDEPHYRWLCRSALFKRAFDGQIHYIGDEAWLVGNSGEITNPKNQIKYFLERDLCEKAEKLDGTSPETIKDLVKAANFVTFLALTFSHCKNCSTKELPSPSPKLQKARISKGKLPLTSRAHVIVIDPMRKAIKSATGSDHYVQSSVALHIVRGHFRTYEENPLFGKYKGTFWVPMHTSGTHGEALKNDYKVKTPQEPQNDPK